MNRFHFTPWRVVWILLALWVIIQIVYWYSGTHMGVGHPLDPSMTVPMKR